MQKGFDTDKNVGEDLQEIYSTLSPTIRKLAAEQNNWWRTRKKYGKLTEGLIRNYVSSRLRDIRLNGRGEADKAIKKMIFDKKRDILSNFLEFIEKNQSVWAQFLYDTASRYDTDALVGFFVPLIYGGIISRKNITGEMVGRVKFDAKNENTPLNERFFGAAGAIAECKRRGNTLIIIDGCPDEVYSQRLLSIYLSSPNEVFIIIEREESRPSQTKRAFLSGDASYKRDVLSALGKAKNVFVVLACNEGDDRIRGKSGALSSYGILHGLMKEGSDESNVGGNDFLQGAFVKKGSALATFDGAISLSRSVNGVDLSSISAENALSLMPSSLMEFFEAPSLPVRLPDLYKLLCVLQFIVSCGNIRELRTKMV